MKVLIISGTLAMSDMCVGLCDVILTFDKNIINQSINIKIIRYFIHPSGKLKLSCDLIH